MKKPLLAATAAIILVQSTALGQDPTRVLRAQPEHMWAVIPLLEVRQRGGDSELWGHEVTVNTPQAQTFRWRIGSQAAGATWKVMDGPPGSGAVVMGSGSAGRAPAAGSVTVFTIDFRTILPAGTPPAGTAFWVVLETRVRAGQTASQSNPVQVTYAAPDKRVAARPREPAGRQPEPSPIADDLADLRRLADRGEQDVQRSEEVAEPGEEVAEPGEEVAEPGEEVAEPGEEVTEPGDEVTEPGDEVAEPGEQVAEPGDEVAEPGDEVAEPGEEVAEQPAAEAGLSREPQTTPTPASAQPSSMVDKSLRSVRLFYGTNRVRTDPCVDLASIRWQTKSTCTPSTFYGNEPVDVEAGTSGLEVGTTRVSFPPDHTTGKIERPLQILGFALRDEDPDKDVLIAELRSFTNDYEAWVREVRSTGRNQAFIYVHGFATTFAEAARRAAQVAYDLDFDLDEDFRGIPMVFSWPSRGGTGGYLVDYDVSLEATDAFNEFLDLVKLRAGVEFVHVIAHSMGNRVVANALTQRGDSARAIVDQLVLAAPDIFSRRFRQRFLNTLPALATRVTLYVSDKDRALTLSEDIREGEPRAGQVAGGLLEASADVDRFDAIDASELKTDFLAHSYYANNNSMLSDIYCLLKGTPPQERPLLVLAGAGWSFRSSESVADVSASACGVLVGPTSGGPRWLWLPLGIGLLLLGVAFGWFLARRRAKA